MSSSAYFYKITPYQVNGTVDVDSLDYDQGYYREEDAPEWAKIYGTYATINNRTIDVFSAGEDMFGIRPTSFSMASYDLDIERFHFEDGSIEEVRREDLEDYYYDDVFNGYVYNRELVAEIENLYMIEGINALDEQIITSAMAESFLRSYMEVNADSLEDSYSSSSYYLYPVYALAKIMFEAHEADESAIICEIG